MRVPPQVRLLPDGRRLHLQHGPIDLILHAFGRPDAVAEAYRAAARRFGCVLDELCLELAGLRRLADPRGTLLVGAIASRMHRAVVPFADDIFITPMAAVAGAVADDVLAHMVAAAELDRVFVNNGGDIAIHLANDQSFRIGVIDRPDRPSLFGHVTVGAEDAVRGIATSGWRGRSFSLGIADSVTVLARDAAAADAAATVIANAVDLPGHPAVHRVPAHTVQADSDLGDRLVTRTVGPLQRPEIDLALGAGAVLASLLIQRDLIVGAALHLQGVTRVVGTMPNRKQVQSALMARRPFVTEHAAHA